MKIALLHYSSPPIVGGVESVLAHQARLMTKAGHQVKILAGRGESFDARIPVRLLPCLDSRHHEVMEVKALLDEGVYLPVFDALRDQIKSELLSELVEVDILIAHNVASLHKNLPLTAAIHDAFTNPDFPALILWHHDLAWTTPRYSAEMHNGYPWDLLRSRWNGAAHVVVSKLRQQELSALTGLPQASIRVIPNGVDVAAFYKLEPQTIQLVEQLGIAEADPLFLLPVRLTARKNIELALRVLAEVKQIFPKAMLLVTGPEGPHNPANALYKEKLLELRGSLGLEGSAPFLAEASAEFLPDAVIADFYRLADALLLPSREEGFGIPLIEAGFSALPVFCADIPVLRELGDEDVSYFSLDAQPAAVARQIAVRLKNETTARWARRAKHAYAWDAIYSSYIEPLIKEVKA